MCLHYYSVGGIPFALTVLGQHVEFQAAQGGVVVQSARGLRRGQEQGQEQGEEQVRRRIGGRRRREDDVSQRAEARCEAGAGAAMVDLSCAICPRKSAVHCAQHHGKRSSPYIVSNAKAVG